MLTSTENPLSGILAVVLSVTKKFACQYHLHAEPYERTDGRYPYAIGFEDRTLPTRLGTFELSIPQVRVSEEPFRAASLYTVMIFEQAPRTTLA